MQRLQDLNQLIASIQNDLTSGAAEIALRAVSVFQTVLEEGENLKPDQLKIRLKDTSGALIACQPAMAPIFI